MILEEKKERLRKSYDSQKYPTSCHGGCDHAVHKPESKNTNKPSEIKGVLCARVLSPAPWTL